ncbi:MAG: HD domain-containing protein [Clostridiales bacterium]|nr:HD domain-containing protein [Clostridiales bacterium]
MNTDMQRVNSICSHPLWKSCVSKIRDLERERIFCCHDTSHFLDVARIAWIENLEKRLAISREMIYAAAMLHDIGRHLQYMQGVPHDEGSVSIASDILKDSGFDEKEQAEILSAIRMHRNPDAASRDDLAGIIYRADKKSRICAFCSASDKCNWPESKKNMKITV